MLKGGELLKNTETDKYSVSRKLTIITKILLVSYFSVKLYYFFYIKLYHLLGISIEKYWITVPVVLFLLTFVVQALLKKHFISIFELSLITILSTIITGIVIKVSTINNLFLQYEELLIVILFFVSFICLAFTSYTKREVLSTKTEHKDELFNLFYINTPKVHEIAMLIDNKIMKTVESERTSQQITKSNFSLRLNKSGTDGTSLSHITEDSIKNSVYESFDVKITKSIMLRTIYSYIKREQTKKSEELGNILLFRNVELEQFNTDDTVMVLNILKDGTINPFIEGDNFELNLSKMIDRLLEDFTIDYIFENNGKKYLIRIPYKSSEYFENSYSHNDLQLGKLSVIGIYRGEIDFTHINSISSRFLEFFSQSYKNELNQNNRNRQLELKLSSNINDDNDYEFNIEHKKLKGKYHLIDLIAIIQEINIKDGESNG